MAKIAVIKAMTAPKTNVPQSMVVWLSASLEILPTVAAKVIGMANKNENREAA